MLKLRKINEFLRELKQLTKSVAYMLIFIIVVILASYYIIPWIL